MGGACSCFLGGEDEPSPRKLVVIGDGACGKSCLIYRFIRGKFDHASTTSEGYIPTVVDTQRAEIEVMRGNRPVQMTLLIYDTGGQEAYEELRKLSYPNSDGVIVCFSLDNEASLSNVENLWLPEMKQHCKDVPLLLVGNKADVRDNPNAQTKGLVPESSGQKVAMNNNSVVEYLECSALTGTGVEKVFKTITEHAMKRKKVVQTQRNLNFDDAIKFSDIALQ